MDSLLSSSDISSGKAASFASGILSSLSSLFGTNAASTGVFAEFLAEQGSVPVPAPQPQLQSQSQSSTSDAPPPDATASSDNSEADAATDESPAGTLLSLISALRHIIHKLDQQSQNNSSGSSSPNNSSGNVASNSTVQSQNTMDANSSSNTQASSGQSASDDSSGDDSNSGTPQSLSGLLSKLAALMKYMEKKLQAAGDTGTSDDTSNSDGGDASASSDPLTQLLGLMQLIQQQLTTSAGGALSGSVASDASSSSASTSASPLMAALQDLTRIQKDLKGLQASFQSHANGGTSSASGSGTGGTNAGDALENATNNLLSSDRAEAGPIDRTLLSSDRDIFETFGNLFSAPLNNTMKEAASAPANINMLVAATDTSAGSTDTSGQDGSFLPPDNNAAGMNSLGADVTTLSPATEGTKNLDPYSFASQLSATRASNGGTVGLPDAVEQVFLQLNRGVKNGNDQMTIQLQPAELGKINIKLQISNDGKVQGTVAATNPSTLSMLQKDARSLERALQEAGLRADPGSLQFSLGGQSGNQTGQTGGNSSSPGFSDGSALSNTEDASADIAVATDEIYYITPGRVNLKV